MTDELASQIQFEIEQIDRLFSSYADLLARCLEPPVPSLIELTAMASVLHSFYNGLENAFLSIAKELDDSVPRGPRWHRDLLAQMAQATPKRKPVISTTTRQRLTDYLGFRHFYRHAYAFFVDWNELEKLVIPLQAVWAQTKSEFQSFLDTL